MQLIKKGKHIHEYDVTSICFIDKLMLIAIGTSNGIIRLFEYEVFSLFIIVFSRKTLSF